MFRFRLGSRSAGLVSLALATLAIGAAEGQTPAENALARPYLSAGVGRGHVVMDTFQHLVFGDVTSLYMRAGGSLGQFVDTALARYVGVEVEASTGLTGGKNSLPFFNTKIDQGWSTSLYAVGRYPIGGRLIVLGRVGYAQTSFDIRAIYPDPADSIRIDETGDGASYGVGLEYLLDAVTVRADFTRYEADITDGLWTENDVLSISVVHRF